MFKFSCNMEHGICSKFIAYIFCRRSLLSHAIEKEFELISRNLKSKQDKNKSGFFILREFFPLGFFWRNFFLGDIFRRRVFPGWFFAGTFLCIFRNIQQKLSEEIFRLKSSKVLFKKLVMLFSKWLKIYFTMDFYLEIYWNLEK